MAFVKGAPRPAGSGRKKGSKNIRKVAKVAEFLAEEGINPAKEILTIIESGALAPKEEVDAWFDLLGYCQAKPKAVEEDAGDDLDPDEFSDMSSADLLKLVKKPNGAS